jgi:NADPH:quinone reductase
MRAASYTHSGPAHEVLELRDVPLPEPAPGEVRVRVRLSGVNPTDWKVRSYGPPLPYPFQIPHHDAGGIIDAVGEGVPASRIGERVWVMLAAMGRAGGTAAEATCVPAAHALPLPGGVTFEQAAGLGIPYVTAHRCLVVAGRPPSARLAPGALAGRSLLVRGGAGAVGSAAVQLASWAGAHVVATVGSPEKADMARASGATHVLDHHSPKHADELAEIAGDGFDGIVEVALTSNLATDIAALAPHGAIVTYATEPVEPQVPVRPLMVINAALHFVLVYGLTPEMLQNATGDVTAALAAGALTPLPPHRFPLEAIADAHDAVERGVLGKVLIDLGGDG